MKRVFRGLAVLVAVLILVAYITVLLPPLASAASHTWTTDTDFNAPGSQFTSTELLGTGTAAHVDLMKDVTDWKNENPGTNPGALEAPSSAFDSRDNVTVLFGGYPFNDKTWEYDHAANTWTEITTTPKPSPRQSAGMSYDPVQRVVVLFGGLDSVDFLTDTWEYNVLTNTWAQITPTTSPPQMVDYPLVYHASAQRHILFGQALITGTMQTWAYDAGADTWTNRNPSGTPSQRSGMALAYSAQRDRTVEFGGALLMTLFDTTFEYNYGLNSWAQIFIPGPTARAGHMMTYRPFDESVLLFGGVTNAGLSQETWRYYIGGGGPTWSPLSTFTKPPARQTAAMTFDTKDNVAVLYGGIDNVGSRLGDTWTLGAAYRSAGKYASDVLDTGGFPTWGTIWWNKTPANQPANTFLRFQVATANTPNPPTWDWSGPGGSSTSYYTTVGQTIWPGHNGNRYLRFLADFGSTDTHETPSMEDVTINWNIPPAPPCIVQTDPADLTFNVPSSSTITILFSESMDKPTVSVSIVVGPPNTFLYGWTGGDSILTATPTTPFEENTVYRLSVVGNDLDGLPLSPTCPDGSAGAQNPFTFVTEKINPWINSTNPANTDTLVPWAQPIVVQFSEGMDTTSLAWSLAPNNVVLSPGWSNGDSTLTLGHTTDFTQCTPYTIQINATDKHGLALVPGPVPNPWNFLSKCDNPYIVSTSPRNFEPGVALNAPVRITFSEPMMRSSLTFSIQADVGGKTLTWSAGDTVLTMTHTSAFTGCGVYTVTVAATDLEGKGLIQHPTDPTVVNPFKFVTVCANPYIIQTIPVDGATNVGQTQEVRIAFSEQMQTSTFQYQITPTATELSRTWEADALLHLQFVVLNQCTHYTMHVTRGENTVGNGLVAGPVPNPWSFDTICNAPYLTSTDPANDTTNVPVDKTVIVTFNKAMNTVTVVENLAPADVTFSKSWSNGDTVLTLTHTAPFTGCQQYILSVDGRSADGNNMILGPGAPGVPNPFVFTTHCAGFYITNTIPAHQQPNVARDLSIVIDFSEAANPASLQWTLAPNTGLSPTWSNGDTRVTLSHTTLFPDCATHTMTISAQNTTGGSLINVTAGSKPNPWTFTTACSPPQILVTDPINGATGVQPMANIVVTFSRAMNPSSITASITGGISLSQSFTNGNTVLTLTHSTPFASGTVYTVQIGGNDAAGNPLVPGPVPNPWSFTTSPGLPAPGGLEVIRVSGGADIELRWKFVPTATSYVIYSTQNRFSWPWPQIGEVNEPVRRFTALGHGSNGATQYYLVRAKDSSGAIGANSTMGVKAHLSFAYSAVRSNVYWMSIPYRSMYRRASDISDELTATRIDVIGKWNPQTQSTLLWFYTRGAWRGSNFAMAPGDGLYLGVRSSFSWVVNGTDGSVSHSFTFYPAPNNNVNWISMPYTHAFSRANEIVRDIEGGVGPGANTKIVEIARWDAVTQTLVRFSWTPTGWSGTDFLLATGEGVYLKVVSTFTWTPRLLTPEVP